MPLLVFLKSSLKVAEGKEEVQSHAKTRCNIKMCERVKIDGGQCYQISPGCLLVSLNNALVKRALTTGLMSEWADLNVDRITLCINSQRLKEDCYGQMGASCGQRNVNKIKFHVFQ